MMNSINNKILKCDVKHSRIAEMFFYLICGAVLAFITYQAVCSSVWENSDYELHYKFSGQLSLLKEMSVSDFLKNVDNSKILSYPIWHIICYFLAQFIGAADESDVKFVIALVTTVFEILAYTACVYGIRKLSSKDCNYLFSGLGALAVLLMGPLKILYVNENYYLGQITANPWHNPTTIAVKAVSFLCFIFYVRIFQEEFVEKEKAKIWEIVMVSILLAISSFLKPSFYQMFVPGLAFACLIELIRTKGKAILFCLKMFASVIPIMFVAVIQMQLSFAEQGNGIGIGFLEVIKLFSQHPVLSILISIPFPLYVVILSYKELIRDKKMLISFCTFLSGAMQYVLFYQTQDAAAGNFAWGAYLGMGIMNLATVCKLYENRNKWSMTKVCAGVFLLSAQIVCGILYLQEIIKTGMYM